MTPLDAFLDAVAGDSEKSLWRITWLEALLSDLEQAGVGTNYEDVEDAGTAVVTEDPSAFQESVRESRDLVKRLRAAMALANKT